MRKIIIILLSCLLVFGIAGCTKDEPTAPSSPTTPSNPTTPNNPNAPTEKSARSELVEKLSANLQYISGKDPGSRFIQVDKDGYMLVAIYCAGGPEGGVIGDVALVEPNKYQVTLEVSAFAGNDFQEAREAYSVTYGITTIDNSTILVKFPEGYEEGEMVLTADNGLPMEALLSVLNSHGTYKEGYNCFSFTTDGMYNRWIDCSEYSESGKISNLVYLGFDRYSFTVDFPKKEATDEMDGSEAYTMKVEITLYNEYKDMAIDEAVGEDFNWFTTTAE